MTVLAPFSFIVMDSAGPTVSADCIQEVFTDPTLVPARWLFPPGAAIDILFGVRNGDGAEVRLRYELSRDPGSWHEVAAEPLSDAETPRHPALQAGDQAWHVRLQGPPREGALRYQLGMVSPTGVVTWMPQARVLVFARSPWRSDMVGTAKVERADGVRVSGPVPRISITPGPSDWRRRLFYSLILDRFARHAQAAPEHSFVRHDPSSPFASHGGTLKGACERLDYLVALGVGAILLSPVYVNGPDGYHGFHPLSLYTVDPHLGTMADLRTLVSEAHKRDIAVVLDLVVSHMASSLVWSRAEDGTPDAVFRYVHGDGETPLFLPEDFRDPEVFYPPEPGTEDGGVEVWRTERTDVGVMLISHIKYWIAQTDIDGIRLGDLDRVDGAFQAAAVQQVSDYARAIGKTHFLTLGSYVSDDASVVGACSKAAGYSGMLDYPWVHRFQQVVVDRTAPLSVLRQSLDHDGWAYRDSRFNLGVLDHRNTSRFLHDWGARFGDLTTARQALAAALAVVVLGPGLPGLYYGTEQEFSGACGTWVDHAGVERTHTAYVREDLFSNPDCDWMYGPLNTPMFPAYQTDTPTFRTIAHLAAVRRSAAAVYAGNRYAVLPTEPDVLAWVMVPEDEDAEAFLIIVDVLGCGPWDSAPIDAADLVRTLPQPHARRIAMGCHAGTLGVAFSLGGGGTCHRDPDGRVRFSLGRYGVAMIGFSEESPLSHGPAVHGAYPGD